MFQETVKKRKPLQIVGIVVVVILALAIVSTFVVYGIFKDSNSAPSIFGKRVYIMSGSGMEPRIPQGAAVFVEEGTLPENEGNVILCNIDGKLALVGYVGSQTTTAEDGTVTTSYIVKYDSTSADQQWTVDEEDIIGRAVSYDTFLGGVITFASSKVGMLVIVIVPCALLIIYEVIMLILASRQKKVEQEEFAADMSFGDVDAFNINRSQFLDTENRTSGDSSLDFGFSSEQMAKSSTPKKDTPLFDFGDFTPKYTHTETEEPTVSEPEPVATAEPAEPEIPAEEPFVWRSVTSTPAPKAVEPEPTVSAEPLAEPEPVVEPIAEPEQVAEPEPVPTVAETATKLDEVAKSLSSNEPAQATSSRIDELIKLLEEEKARLADKK
ncbi:MAG: hypothetical protein LUH56_06810 [Oscillospiraceae bacterium]|nr:hypothetical protein [Oscillospiraceae bacterium]